MTLRTIACTLVLMAATAAVAALKAGEPAPAFSAPASLAGKPFSYSLKDSLAKGPVVVYFYPSAYTAGCNIQAHEFSTKADQFTAAGASVIGVSLDSIERLNEFSADPDYAPASWRSPPTATAGSRARSACAERRAARRHRHPWQADRPRLHRAHDFVIQRDGTVLAAVGGVSPEENVARALELVRKLPRYARGATECSSAGTARSSCSRCRWRCGFPSRRGSRA